MTRNKKLKQVNIGLRAKAQSERMASAAKTKELPVFTEKGIIEVLIDKEYKRLVKAGEVIPIEEVV